MSGLILLTTALAFGTTRSGHADPPQITVGPEGARIRIVSASLSEAIDALARAGGFRVIYQGARPTAMLFNAEIDARTVGEALLRLLEGQSLNYGVVFDVTGTSVTSLLVLAPASGAGSAQAPFGNSAPPPQSLPTPRRAPRRDSPMPEVEPEIGEPEPEPEPEPSPVATPTSTPSPTPPPLRLSPFAPRSPFPPPLPTAPPPPAPTPSPSPSA